MIRLQNLGLQCNPIGQLKEIVDETNKSNKSQNSSQGPKAGRDDDKVDRTVQNDINAKKPSRHQRNVENDKDSEVCGRPGGDQQDEDGKKKEHYPTHRSHEKSLVCFPCAVVEIKHHAVKEPEVQKCFCQAANGSSTSLALLRSLSRYSVHKGNFRNFRPVVSFTFIGYNVRVWVTYIESESYEQVQGHEKETSVYVSLPKKKKFCIRQ